MAFYKLDNNELQIAETCISGLDLDLHYLQKDSYTYPVQGWYWFDTEDEAKIFFNIPITENFEE
jgi:hypothetical protein